MPTLICVSDLLDNKTNILFMSKYACNPDDYDGNLGGDDSCSPDDSCWPD